MIARTRGMQALLEKQIHVLLTYPSAGWPGAKSVRMHALSGTAQPPTESSASAGEALQEKDKEAEKYR